MIFDKQNRPIKLFGIIQDISKQNAIEVNLKGIGEDLLKAQRVAGVGSWKYSFVKDEFVGTEEIYRIMDLEMTDTKYNIKDIVNVLHADDHKVVIGALKLLLSGQTVAGEIRIPRDGETDIYATFKGEPIFDRRGNVEGAIGTLEDITENKVLENELKKAHEILAQAQYLAKMGSWEMDMHTHKFRWSEEAFNICGIDSKNFDNTYESFLKYVHPDDLYIIEKMFGNPSREPMEIEFRVVHSDGTIRNVYEMAEYKFNSEDKPVYIYGTIQDVTEQKELQIHIDRIQRRYEVLIQESMDVFQILKPDGTVLYMSEAAERVTGYRPEDCLGKKIYEFYDETEHSKIKNMTETVLEAPGNKVMNDVVFITKDGNPIYIEMLMQNMISDPAVNGITMSFRDITKRVEMQNTISYMSTHDELTGLPNRIYLKNEMETRFNKSKNENIKFAVLMIDIDKFNKIVDALGYKTGDKLIIQISNKIKEYLSEKSFFCRYSEDRFVIIHGEINHMNEYEKFAKEITDLFHANYIVDKYEIEVNIHIGISLCRKDNKDFERLIKHTEVALYWAKNEGKNNYKFYFSDTDEQNYKLYELRSDLRKAVENNQLHVYYQPIMNLKTNTIIAAEVLLRWNHPVHGLIPPKEFIPMAEETGYIINIGNWLIEEVCKSYNEWLNKGMPKIKISVNYSAIQFFENNFVENIINTIKKYRLTPSFLIIEITESILIDNTDKAISDIKRLKAYGIQIALDDFGTGFSSLSYLSSLKIDILKIDRSFIKNISIENNSTIITKNIINMAQELNIKLVAEGVEKPNQLEFLRNINCYAGQGYIYSKPLPKSDFEVLLYGKSLRPSMYDEN